MQKLYYTHRVGHRAHAMSQDKVLITPHLLYYRKTSRGPIQTMFTLPCPVWQPLAA